MKQEGGFIRRLMCKYNKHIFLERHKSGAFLYGSYDDSKFCSDLWKEKMCVWCKAYYVEGKKVRNNFYEK